MSINTTLTTSGVSTSVVLPLDWRTNPFQVGILCYVTGTVTYSVQHSDDPTFTNWSNNANISGATASADTNYMFPVRYIRVNQTGGTGSVLAYVVQSGPNK
jgi:hypothetical protein